MRSSYEKSESLELEFQYLMQIEELVLNLFAVMNQF